ncbi:MAG: chemotaxis protein CheX [Fusobacteriota bacterium]
MDYKKITQEAIRNTAIEMLGKDVTMDEVIEESSPLHINEFAIIVGIGGEIAGQLIFDFKDGLALKIASILIEQDMDEFDELSRSAVSEFANVLGGHVTMDLVDAGSDKLGMSPPSMIMGENMSMSTKIKPIYKIDTYIKDLGEMCVHMALKEREKEGDS